MMVRNVDRFRAEGIESILGQAFCNFAVIMRGLGMFEN